ncbi:DEAD/DEAH box helicase family protein [Paraliobacillus zengyii]|uniref:DEAD/DEAH box helicase family protein n=1 Tax=Paraliobacillus zengyii TaxID=2213194 RepID=UPI000E3BF17A|nr:DEAD/DEAH box helicase family protein [Paraliobacillus zengyii]
MIKSYEILSNSFKDWYDLESTIEGIDSTYEKGNVMEVFAKFYFEFHKSLYEIHAVYMRHEIPKRIIDDLKLEETDRGVDGVYVRTDGKVVAYQVKFRTNRATPTYRELATFWTESEHADFRMIISNSNKLPVEHVRRKKQMAILGNDLDELDSSFFEALSLMAKGNKPPERVVLEPRDYQKKIINDVLTNFKINNRGKVIAACGTGKTLVSKWIHDGIESKYTLFIAPSLTLIKQTIEEWTSKTDKPITFLAVCSDQSVISDIYEDTNELGVNEVNFPVTTDPNVIKEFLSKETKFPKVIFSTYQSVDAITNALLAYDEEFSFDLALYDEAHRTAGIKESEMFVYGLEDRYIPIKNRLFLTATEKNISNRVKKFAQDSGTEYFSMDDPHKYGVTFSELNFGNAIEKGIIADYKVVVCAMDEEELIELAKKNYYVQVDVGDESISTSMDNLLKQVILAKAVEELGIKKIVSYHSRVDIATNFITGSKHQMNLRDVFSQVTPSIKDTNLYLNHVNGSMSAGKRKQILNNFEKSEFGVISNAKCLTEGVDVPAIDAVYFADSKDSTVDIIQAIGRSLRKKKDEDKTSYILLPVILPSEATTFSGIKSEAFNTLHSVVQALRDQDKSLAHTIDEVNYTLGAEGYSPKKGRTNNELRNKLMVLVSNKIKIENFETALQFRIGEVNKHSTMEPSKVIFTGAKGERTGSIKRVFTSMGDYNMEAYKNSLVIPTLNRFNSKDEILSGSEIKINNNNVSHTYRLGAVNKESKNYSLTDIGIKLKENPAIFDDVFKNQLLNYFIHHKDTNSFLFPYRAWFKVLKETEKIRKFDFIYGLYPLKSTDDGFLENAIDQVIFLQDTYTEVELFNDDNKEKILNMLNQKFGIEIAYQDVWTSRGTSYNQFNYFIKHLLSFHNIFQKSKTEKHVIELIPGAKVSIDSMLEETKEIEEIAQNTKSAKLVRDKYISY